MPGLKINQSLRFFHFLHVKEHRRKETWHRSLLCRLQTLHKQSDLLKLPQQTAECCIQMSTLTIQEHGAATSSLVFLYFLPLRGELESDDCYANKTTAGEKRNIMMRFEASAPKRGVMWTISAMTHFGCWVEQIKKTSRHYHFSREWGLYKLKE